MLPAPGGAGAPGGVRGGRGKAADEAGRPEAQARIYGPRRCGPDGGTECPYVVLGRLEEDGAGQ